jgi:hypothetical protein
MKKIKFILFDHKNIIKTNFNIKYILIHILCHINFFNYLST